MPSTIQAADPVGHAAGLQREPLQYTGSLNNYDSTDLTAAIGREFPGLQLSEIITNDTKVRDLAVLCSQRGVVFLRNQDISPEQLKVLTHKLGVLTGKPEESKLHRHALSSKDNKKNWDANGEHDEEIFYISSVREMENHASRFEPGLPKLASYLWHSDITFETVPSDYGALQMIDLPGDPGGDTIFASGYELFDRMSPAFKKLAEGLTATHWQPVFSRIMKNTTDPLIAEDRGHPDNRGLDFKATHPVVRTNPVTGWKSLFGVGQQIHDGKINGVTDREEENLKAYFLQLVTENHDLQVRFKWGANDIALWDQRSTVHTATMDYQGERKGIRVTSVGEKPYLDPASLSRREALRMSEIKKRAYDASSVDSEVQDHSKRMRT